MFVEFSVKNFRSIKELQTISFAATGLKSPKQYEDVDTNNIVEEDGRKLLKTVGIYGANGSGKSNIILALEYLFRAIKNEPSSESKLRTLSDPFLYQDNFSQTESFFQIVFILNEKKYRYGFTVKRNIVQSEKDSKEIVTNEWLYGPKEKNTVLFFKRKGIHEDIYFPSNVPIPILPYKHTLFLTHAAAYDSKGVCNEVRSYLMNFTLTNFTKDTTAFIWNSFFFIENLKKKEDLLRFFTTFNLKYDDVEIERDNNFIEDQMTHDKIHFTKSYKNEKIKLNLKFNESSGTQKLFDIAGLLLRAFNMDKGGIIILDELDSNFHPALLIKIIGLFNDPNINKSNVQLLFTSHDTNLLSSSIMRRDQFYFAEKNEDESTRLYSLADLKGIRNDADFAKEYLAGFYGALPILETYLNNNPIQDNGTLGN